MLVMIACAKCGSELPDDGLYVSCKGCSGCLHFECTSVAKKTYGHMSAVNKDTWRCETCRLAKSVSELVYDKLDLASELKEIKKCVGEHQIKLDDRLGLLEERLAGFADDRQEVDERFNLLMNKLEDSYRRIEELLRVNKEKGERIDHLNDRLNELEQRCVNRDMIVQGIEEKPEEELKDIVLQLAGRSGIHLEDSEIENVRRIKVRTGGTQPAHRRASGPIVVTLTTNTKRSLFLKQKGLNLGNIQSERSESENGRQRYDIRFREYMTSYNKKLYAFTRDRLREKGWKHLWFAYGVIRVRREDGSRMVFIRRESDIVKIV